MGIARNTKLFGNIQTLMLRQLIPILASELQALYFIGLHKICGQVSYVIFPSLDSVSITEVRM
jgi:hypothetical protein